MGMPPLTNQQYCLSGLIVVITSDTCEHHWKTYANGYTPQLVGQTNGVETNAPVPILFHGKAECSGALGLHQLVNSKSGALTR